MRAPLCAALTLRDRDCGNTARKGTFMRGRDRLTGPDIMEFETDSERRFAGFMSEVLSYRIILSVTNLFG
jgi:hypothetical protein